MNKFIKHVPGFVEGDNCLSIMFKTKEDLLSDSVFKRCINRNQSSHFEISGNVLIEVSNNGFHWVAVGYIENPEDIDLPKFEGGKFLAEMDDGVEVVLTKAEVAYACGDILTLRDGTKAKWKR